MGQSNEKKRVVPDKSVTTQQPERKSDQAVRDAIDQLGKDLRGFLPDPGAKGRPY